MNFLKHKKTLIVIILVAAIFGIAFIYSNNSKAVTVKGPDLVKGYADLTSWDFERAGGMYLGGEWEVYNGVFLSPEELHKTQQQERHFEIVGVKKPVIENELHKPVTLRAVLRVRQHELFSLRVIHNNVYQSRVWVNGDYMTDSVLSDAKLLSKAGIREIKAKDIGIRWNVTGVGTDSKIEVIIQTTEAVCNDFIAIGIDDMEKSMDSTVEVKVVNVGLFGALIIMGLYQIIFYFIRKSDRAPLYIGMTSASMACLLVLNYFDSSLARHFNLQYSLQSLILVRCILLVAILLSGGAFTNALYKEEAFPRIYRFLTINLKLWIFAGIIISLVTDIQEWMNFYNYGNIMVVLFVCYYCIVVAKAFLRKREGAGIFLASYIFTALVAFHDVLVDWGTIRDTQFYYYYGLLCVIISMAIIMAKRFSSLYEEQVMLAAELSASHEAVKKKNSELQSMWREVTESRNELASLNSNLEFVVKRRTSTIRNLLDNAGQGFLSFDSSLIIEEDYSMECEKIFDCSLRGVNFIDLIAKYDIQEKNTIEQILDRVLKQRTRKSAYLSLLPHQIQVYEKMIQLEYRLMADSMTASGVKMMVVLTDITEKHALEKALEMKRKHLEMVVKVVVHPKDFHECIQDYISFCQHEYREILELKLPNAEKKVQILRKIHTMKGNFAQFELGGLVESLHKLEDSIIEFSSEEGEISDFEKLIDITEMMAWLDQEVENLEGILGKGYVSKSNIVTIEMNKLIEIENKIREMFSENEGKVLLMELRRLRYRSLREMLEPYVDYSHRLAERLEKNISVELFVAEDIMVDSERYHDFIKSLVHVFRNAVDHGLEDEDERIESGKSEIGHIKCKAYFEGEKKTLVIEIIDDGKGINSEVIQEKAIQLGLITEEVASGMDEKSIIRQILKDSFSTSQETSLISGRGVGLSATAAEVEKLLGNIEIKTEPSEGTSFVFSIPNV